MSVVETKVTGDSTAQIVYIHGWGAEGLKYNLARLLTVGFLGCGGCGFLFFTGIVAVVPDFLHVLPVGDKLCSIGYFRVRVLLLFWALSPM